MNRTIFFLIALLFSLFSLFRAVYALSWLHTSGMYIYNESNQRVNIYGPHLFYGGGQGFNLTDVQKIKSLGFNTFRIMIYWGQIQPYNETTSGIDVSYFTSGKYPLKHGLDEVVNWAVQENMYLIITMFWSESWPTPSWAFQGYTNDDQKFSCLINGTAARERTGLVNTWKYIANRYKNVPNVIFEFTNEPIVTDSSLAGNTYKTFNEGIISAMESVETNSHLKIAELLNLNPGWLETINTSVDVNKNNFLWATHRYNPMTGWDPSSKRYIESPFTWHGQYFQAGWVNSTVYVAWRIIRCADKIHSWNKPWIDTEFSKYTTENYWQDWFDVVLNTKTEYNITGWIFYDYINNPNDDFGRNLNNATTAALIMPFLTSHMLQNFTSAPTSILFGRLVNKTGSPIQAATISVDSTKTSTGTDGTYSLSVPKAVYDINYSTQNLWIKLMSFNLSSDQKDLVNYITKTNVRTSFDLNISKDQLTQVYSDKKPIRVLINGTNATEVGTFAQLNGNSWLYNSTENKLYINYRPVSQIRLGTYTSSWNFHEYTAETIAAEFNMSQSAWVYDPRYPEWNYTLKMNRVHELNPGYKALVYRNLMVIINVSDINDPSAFEWSMANNNGWLLKDVDGNFVRSTTYPTHYYVDITNPDYQKWVANRVKSWLDQYPFYDGVFADNSIKISVTHWLYDTSTVPINPRTGTYFTDQEIRNGYIQLNREVKSVIGSKLLACNGVWNGRAFFESYNQYMEVISNAPIDIIMSEGLCTPNNGNWYSQDEWLKSINFTVWIQDNFLKNHPERYFVGVDSSYPNIITGSTENQTALYGFASMLLGVKTDKNHIYFGRDLNDSFIAFIEKLHKTDVGLPENDYYKIEGTNVYSKDFSKAKVLVNPSTSFYVIPLGNSYRNLKGEIVSEVTMAGHTGEILLKL